MSLVLDEHRQYLADIHRIGAFDRAIREVVRPGDTVLDLGCGTAILGMMACRAGARKVYSVDSGGMLGVARSLALRNGYADRLVGILGSSTRVELPERVDVVIADQMGRFGFEAGVLEFFEDARRRHLKEGGRLLPSSIELWVAPVEHSEAHANVEFWNGAPGGFDFTPALGISRNTGYPLRYQPRELLASPARGCTLDLTRTIPDFFRLQADLTVERPGSLHGIGGWFSAQLSPSVTMTNSPLAADAIARRNVFFPLSPFTQVQPGDRVSVKMAIRHADLLVNWTVHVSGADGQVKGRFQHSTLQGMLLVKEELARTTPQSVPRINKWGRARQSVLELTDGRTSLAVIEKELLRRHPDLFPNLSEAAFFVAEVLVVYGETS